MPWLQKGTAETLAIGSSAPVTGMGIRDNKTFNQTNLGAYETDGSSSVDFATPKMTSPGGGYVPPVDWSSPSSAELASALQDYFGIPTSVGSLEHHNYLGRAYNLIYNEWFRDENLQDSVVVDKDDGTDTYTDYQLLKRGKRPK